jgi:hypothetical protein
MTGSGIQKLIRGDSQTQTQTQRDDLVSLLLFFQNKQTKNVKVIKVVDVILFNYMNPKYDSHKTVSISTFPVYETPPYYLQTIRPLT